MEANVAIDICLDNKNWGMIKIFHVSLGLAWIWRVRQRVHPWQPSIAACLQDAPCLLAAKARNDNSNSNKILKGMIAPQGLWRCSTHLPAELVEAQRPAHEAAHSTLIVRVRIQKEGPPQALPGPPRSRRENPSQQRRLRQRPSQPRQQVLHLHPQVPPLFESPGNKDQIPNPSQNHWRGRQTHGACIRVVPQLQAR